MQFVYIESHSTKLYFLDSLLHMIKIEDEFLSCRWIMWNISYEQTMIHISDGLHHLQRRNPICHKEKYNRFLSAVPVKNDRTELINEQEMRSTIWYDLYGNKMSSVAVICNSWGGFLWNTSTYIFFVPWTFIDSVFLPE